MKTFKVLTTSTVWNEYICQAESIEDIDLSDFISFKECAHQGDVEETIESIEEV